MYEWRLEPERAMRATKGRGMSDEQVIRFVDGCKYRCARMVMVEPNSTPDYPAYELYTDVLRRGIFDGEKGKQLRLIVDKNRRVEEVEYL